MNLDNSKRVDIGRNEGHSVDTALISGLLKFSFCTMGLLLVMEERIHRESASTGLAKCQVVKVVSGTILRSQYSSDA